jgi:hypothetical protein
VSFPLSYLFLCSLCWWPGQWARHACLLQLCCAWACDVVLELLCWPLHVAAITSGFALFPKACYNNFLLINMNWIKFQ